MHNRPERLTPETCKQKVRELLSKTPEEQALAISRLTLYELPIYKAGIKSFLKDYDKTQEKEARDELQTRLQQYNKRHQRWHDSDYQLDTIYEKAGFAFTLKTFANPNVTWDNPDELFFHNIVRFPEKEALEQLQTDLLAHKPFLKQLNDDRAAILALLNVRTQNNPVSEEIKLDADSLDEAETLFTYQSKEGRKQAKAIETETLKLALEILDNAVPQNLAKLELENKLKKLTADYEPLKQTEQKHAEKLQALQQENTQLKQEKTKLTELNSQLLETNTQLTTNNTELKSTNDKLNRISEKYEGEFKCQAQHDDELVAK